MSTVDEPASRAASAPAPMAKLNAALSRAQSEFPPIERKKEVKTGSYSYRYADLADILNAVRPVLAKHGLSLIQLMTHGEHEEAMLRTELRHDSGEMVGSSWPIRNVPTDPKLLGGLLTYLRRYSVSALLGIAAEDDDDAQRASGDFKAPRSGETLSTKQGGLIRGLRDKLIERKVLTKEAFEQAIEKEYGVVAIGDLTRRDASELIDRLSSTEAKLQAKEEDDRPAEDE